MTVAANTVDGGWERSRRVVHARFSDFPEAPKSPKHIGAWLQYHPTKVRGGEVGCQPNTPSGASGASGIRNKSTFFFHPTCRPHRAHLSGHGVCRRATKPHPLIISDPPSDSPLVRISPRHHLNPTRHAATPISQWSHDHAPHPPIHQA